MSFDMSLLKLAIFNAGERAQDLNVTFSLFLVTILVFLVLAIYVHGNVIATLVATLRPDPEARARAPLSRKRFRGLSIFVLHRVLKIFLISKYSMVGFNPMDLVPVNVFAELLLSNLKVANVHAILDSDSAIPLYRCVFSWSTWSKTFLSVLLYSIVSSIGVYLPARVVQLSDDWGRKFDLSHDMLFAALIAFVAILYFGAVVPTYAIFIRVAASILPPKKGTREKKSRAIGILGAWISLPWSNLFSFYKSLAGVFVMEIGVTIVLCLLTLAHFSIEHQDGAAQFLIKYLG